MFINLHAADELSREELWEAMLEDRFGENTDKYIRALARKMVKEGLVDDVD